MRYPVVPMLPDPLLPPGCSDSDPYFDLPSVGEDVRSRRRKVVKVICPKCHGDYMRDPMRKCARCLKGFAWVEEENSK